MTVSDRANCSALVDGIDDVPDTQICTIASGTSACPVGCQITIFMFFNINIELFSNRAIVEDLCWWTGS